MNPITYQRWSARGRFITSLVAGGDGGGHEDGEALALALEGGYPASGTERQTGAEQRAIQLMYLALLVLRVFHPSHLHTTAVPKQ